MNQKIYFGAYSVTSQSSCRIPDEQLPDMPSLPVKVKSAGGAEQALVSHRNREFWQQKVWQWCPQHLHQGKKGKHKSKEVLIKMLTPISTPG